MISPFRNHIALNPPMFPLHGGGECGDVYGTHLLYLKDDQRWPLHCQSFHHFLTEIILIIAYLSDERTNNYKK